MLPLGHVFHTPKSALEKRRKDRVQATLSAAAGSDTLSRKSFARVCDIVILNEFALAQYIPGALQLFVYHLARDPKSWLCA